MSCQHDRETDTEGEGQISKDWAKGILINGVREKQRGEKEDGEINQESKRKTRKYEDLELQGEKTFKEEIKN